MYMYIYTHEAVTTSIVTTSWPPRVAPDNRTRAEPAPSVRGNWSKPSPPIKSFPINIA